MNNQNFDLIIIGGGCAGMMAAISARNQHPLYKIWGQVPATYYQDGIKKNLLQRLWHTHYDKAIAGMEVTFILRK